MERQDLPGIDPASHYTLADAARLLPRPADNKVSSRALERMRRRGDLACVEGEDAGGKPCWLVLGSELARMHHSRPPAFRAVPVVPVVPKPPPIVVLEAPPSRPPAPPAPPPAPRRKARARRPDMADIEPCRLYTSGETGRFIPSRVAGKTISPAFLRSMREGRAINGVMIGSSWFYRGSAILRVLGSAAAVTRPPTAKEAAARRAVSAKFWALRGVKVPPMRE
jgi:hypothetical protein